MKLIAAILLTITLAADPASAATPDETVEQISIDIAWTKIHIGEAKHDLNVAKQSGVVRDIRQARQTLRSLRAELRDLRNERTNTWDSI